MQAARLSPGTFSGTMRTVVTQDAHGLCQGPSRVCVGGEASVVYSKGCVIALILEILVVLSHHN